MKRPLLSVLVFALITGLILPVDSVEAADHATRKSRRAAWCGTWDWGIEVALAKHQANLRRRGRGFQVQSASNDDFQVAVQVDQNGDVAVIRDDGTLILDENPFDFQNDGVKFVRRGRNGYKFKDLGGSVREDLGDRLNLGDDDAERIDLPGGFEITYFGEQYTSLFVNSDGNLTFGESDTASTSRDMQRFLNGPPRVAGFFADLDPSAATGDGGVYLRLTEGKLQITWWKVPEFDGNTDNTFQMIMNARGNVEVRFGEVAATEAIIGVAPGNGSGVELIDLSEELPIKARGVAMAERFTEDQSLDEAAVAAAFYERFVDDYDQLVMFTDFGRRAADNAIAYHLTVKNRVRGIGKPVYDGSRFFGSRGRLGGFINMGGASQYSDNVNQTGFWNLYSAADILAHELGHQWLVRATFIDAQGRENTDLLGRGNAHWSYYFDSDLSFMEGNEIEDNGNGLYTTQTKRATYNPFDRYLMGLIPASEVPAKFYVDGNGTVGPNNQPAKSGETIAGTRIDVSIDQIIGALGERNPSVAESQKDFRIGFILLVKPGQQPKADSIQRVQRFADEIGGLFNKETRRAGSLDTALVPR